MTQYLRINPADNVAVALFELKAGTPIEVDNISLTLCTDIPAGHKFLLTPLRQEERIIKYGYPIGHITTNGMAGQLVDDRTIKTDLDGLKDYTYSPVFTDAELEAKQDSKVDYSCEGLPTHFRGYRRKNGDVGIRNEVWIIPTVGCVNGIVNQLCDKLKTEVGLTAAKADGYTDGVERIVAFPHNYGCSQLSEDHENTRHVLRDMVLHPNAAAVLVVGLGCENNQPDAFRELLGDYDTSRIRFLVTQQCDGDEIEQGMAILRELYAMASQDFREEIPLSELRVGLKCGGSDGFSGITANPLLGVFSDYIVSQGGTTVLTEVPEMFGAETILMNRCANRELFDQTVSLINDFKQYFLSHGEPIGENPSPGNKAGGISTLEEKALGCTQKCGKSAVRGVMDYGERITNHGLNLLSAPGNDLVASTALAASGCHIVLFTTGRGTPFGTFVPTMKVSTNPRLAASKPHWIDFSAGPLIEGKSMEELFRDFAQRVVDIANGKPTNNELRDYQEIAIFKKGVTL